MTHEITDEDREYADRVLRAIDPKSRLEPIAASEGVAWAIARARAAGYAAGAEASRAVFEALFAGDPDTPCRTTWRRDAGHSLPGSTAPLTECVEVPLDDLRATFDEAERVERGDA